MIEINPRPTTSYVGLVRLLPPGTIARAWLDLFSGGNGRRPSWYDRPGSGPRDRIFARRRAIPDGQGRVMTTSAESWLALDVGGANIKAAHSAGRCGSVPFELWRRPDELGQAIAAVAAAFPPFDRVALTMTAELCDCYPTKRDGVRAVLDAVSARLPGRPVVVWGLDGRLRPIDEVRERPELAAAANWLALATVAARLVGRRDGPARRRRLDDHRPDPAPRRRGRRDGPDRHRAVAERRAGLRRRPADARLRPRRPPPVPGPRDRRSPPSCSRRPSTSSSPSARSPKTPTTARRPTADRPRSRRAATAWRGWSAPTAKGSPPRTPPGSPNP